MSTVDFTEMNLRPWPEEDIFFLAKMGCIQPPASWLYQVIEAIKEVKRRAQVSATFVYSNQKEFVVSSKPLKLKKDDTCKKPTDNPSTDSTDTPDSSDRKVRQRRGKHVTRRTRVKVRRHGRITGRKSGLLPAGRKNGKMASSVAK